MPELMSEPMPEHQPARSSRRDLPEEPLAACAPSTRTSGALVVDVVEHQAGARTAGRAGDKDQPAAVVEQSRFPPSWLATGS